MEDKMTKIVVKTQDELIDVVREISKTDSKRIIVTFAEESDILISSINLKVLQDSADEKEALLILQITNNSTGVRNAKLAGINVTDTPTSPTQEDWNIAQQEYESRILKLTKSSKVIPEEYKSENITSFEQRINSVLDKNKEGRQKENSTPKVVEEDMDIVVDQDITTEETTPQTPDHEDLTKMDFKHVPDPTKEKSTKKFKLANIFTRSKKSSNTQPKKVTIKKEGIQDQKQSNKTSDIKSRLVRLLPKLLIPFVVVLLLVAFIYYKFAPYVKVTLHVQSKPVEVETIFEGNENINQIDFTKLEIPIKTETTNKSVSDVVEATGIAYRGEKASGSVKISFIKSEGCTDADTPITFTSGTKISVDSKQFVLTGNVTVTCNSYADGEVNVEAIEVGEEYNLPGGKYFSVAGYNSTTVYAVNGAAFSGGSKEDYTVLSQQDVNTKVEELTDIAKEEAVGALEDIGNGWELIESTVKSDVKEGSIKTAVSIGSEATTSDVSLEVEASATYYFTSGVDDGLNQLLTEAALNQNLFENTDGLSLTLTGDIAKELTVEDSKKGVQIKLVASSSVEPSVNREDIISALRGMSWEEGNAYVDALTFISREPTVVFTPEGFPQKLRHFPSRQGRIDVRIEKDIEE